MFLTVVMFYPNLRALDKTPVPDFLTSTWIVQNIACKPDE